MLESSDTLVCSQNGEFILSQQIDAYPKLCVSNLGRVNLKRVGELDSGQPMLVWQKPIVYWHLMRCTLSDFDLRFPILLEQLYGWRLEDLFSLWSLPCPEKGVLQACGLTADSRVSLVNYQAIAQLMFVIRWDLLRRAQELRRDFFQALAAQDGFEQYEVVVFALDQEEEKAKAVADMMHHFFGVASRIYLLMPTGFFKRLFF